MTEENELKGLGGWLMLVGLGVVVSPLRMLATFIPTYKPIFEDGTWQALTAEGSEVYNPYFAPLLIGEIAFNAVFFALSLYLIYLFFSKHYLFPKIYIGIVAASLVFIPLDAWVVTKVFPGEQVFDPETTSQFVRSLVAAAIWVPYMFVSERVQVTFVERMPVRETQRSAKASSD